MSPHAARLECYERIRTALKRRAEEYYRQHPDRMDARADEGIMELTAFLIELFDILEDYDVTAPPAEKPVEKNGKK
jgi:hypothetical protein